MEINSVTSSNLLQNNSVTEQETVPQNEVEQQETSQQVAGSEDTVNISSEPVAATGTTQETSIQNAQQAEETANRVVELFQTEPELAATAQGGQVTSEKVDAYLSANIGG